MPPRTAITDEDHIVFLLACLRNSPGPINFNKVAQDLGIVSVGAASKRFSRLSQKYQNGVVNGETDTGEEGGVKMEDTDGSPSKKTPKKANRSGKGAVKTEASPSKDAMAAITAPRAAGVGKKRSPVKSKANTTAALITSAAVEGFNLKTENEAQNYEDDDGDADFVPGFFNEQISRGVMAGEHDDDTY